MFKLFKRKANPLETSAIITTEIAGHRFTVLDPVKMPIIRRKALHLDEYKRHWGIDKEDLNKYLGFIQKESEFPESTTIADQNKKLAEKLKNIYAVSSALQSYLAQDYQYKPFIYSAAIMILIDDEKENEIDGVKMNQKIKLCNENEDIAGFFLTTIRTFHLKTLNISDTLRASNLSSLNINRSLENQILSEIDLKT